MTTPGNRLTMAVAEWVATLDCGAIPEATRGVIRAHLLDTLVCGLHGRSTEWASIIERWARAQAPAGERGGLATV